MDDLNGIYALASQDEASATEDQLPVLKIPEDLDSPEQSGTLLSPTDFFSLNFPCNLIFDNRYILGVSLDQLLLEKWIQKLRYVNSLRLMHPTLDFSECHNRMDDSSFEFLVAYSLRPFNHEIPGDLVILPDERKAMLTRCIQHLNLVYSKRRRT
ncbi:MAG: hypothetical protein Q9182_002005 [Xanthomendoza sp. 2 TL-2023]